MNQTSNYQLNQWGAADRILREDFNRDNAKIDAALAGMAAAQSELAAQIANCGNCSISITSYTGTGTSGTSNPTKINFSRKPVAFIVRGYRTLVIWTNLDSSTTFVMADGGNGVGLPTTTVSWSGNQAQLVNTSSMYAAAFQANESSRVYHVIAFYSN